MPYRESKNGNYKGWYAMETVVPASGDDEPQKAKHLRGIRSNWRDVLAARPATGTRVDVSTGRAAGTVRGTGEFSTGE